MSTTITDKKRTAQHLEQLFERECRFYSIKPVRKFAAACGRAIIASRTVEVPKSFSTVERFMVALHEIAHIKQGNVRPSYYGEYLAERFALRRAKELNIDPGDYEVRARAYVLTTIAKAYNRGLKLDSIPAFIVEWVQHDFSSWEGHKVFIRRSKKAENGYTLELTPA